MNTVMSGDGCARILSECETESERRLDSMRATAQEMFGGNPDYLIGVKGSVARRECTVGSDADLFFLIGSEVSTKDARSARDEYCERLRSSGLKIPSNGGVFEKPLEIEELVERIGGENDTNEFLTRHMLFLLEGEWIHNCTMLKRTRTRLIKHYVVDDLERRKLCMFLLNHVIRYCRTICVDLEHKTVADAEPRAIRLVKLRFSRMLLYLGGMAAVSRTRDLPVPGKRWRLEELFALWPIARLREVFGDAAERPLSRDPVFLDWLNSPECRDKLELDGDEGLRMQDYQDLCDDARKFRDGLYTMLMKKFGHNDDLIKALLL